MAKYLLKAQTITLLRAIINMPGTAKDPQQAYVAGKLLVDVLPEPPPEPKDVEIEVEISGPERDFCKAAYTFALSKEAVPNTKYSYELVTALEFVSVPKP